MAVLLSRTAATPGCGALPLVERPCDVVLIVRRRDVRRNADEPGAAHVIGRGVPGGLEELVGTEVRAGRVHRAVVAAALAGPHARQEGVVVVRAGARCPR